MANRERSIGPGKYVQVRWTRASNDQRKKLKFIEDVCARLLKTTLQGGDGSETFSDLTKVTQLGNCRSL